MKKLIFLTLCLLPLFAHAGEPTEDSAKIVKAALEQIQWTIQTHDTATDCSTYVSRVLARAGTPVGGFLSNDFGKVMASHLPNWKRRDFSTDHPGGDQVALRDFLNGFPDGTALLAQWRRVGKSGHIAIVEKLASDQFMIFQAQQGRALPHASPARVSQLLYAPNAYGDRAHLSLYFE
jgi:hypothetical protein